MSDRKTKMVIIISKTLLNLFSENVLVSKINEITNKKKSAQYLLYLTMHLY